MATDAGESPEEFLETLDTAACARLLAATEFGRIAVVEGDRPRIVVLNHLVQGTDVLFRTGEGAFLARLTKGRAVRAAYEVDSSFRTGRTGWSVIAIGLLERESDPARIASAREHLSAWVQGERDLVLRLGVEELTGRRAGRP